MSALEVFVVEIIMNFPHRSKHLCLGFLLTFNSAVRMIDAVVFRNFEKTNFQPIVYIAAVTKQESANINLVAVTHSGQSITVHHF